MGAQRPSLERQIVEHKAGNHRFATCRWEQY